MTSQWSRQEGGNHYKQFKIQPSEYIWKNNLTWFAANIVKYATRAPFKGKAIEDLRKVIHYAELWIEEIVNEREDGERAGNPEKWVCMLPTVVEGKAWCGATRSSEATPCPRAADHAPLKPKGGDTR